MSRNGRQTPRSGSVHHGHKHSQQGANTNNEPSTSQTQPSGTAPEQHLLKRGNTVNGYTLTSEQFLGEGNTGVVALCQDNNGKAVAIKVMLEKGTGEIKTTQLSELGNLRKLGSHKKIVELIDSFSYVYNNSEYCCIVMEYAKDGDLRALMQGSGSEVYAKAIINQVCKGLEYIHSKHGERHCVHADIKPGNILIKNLNPPKILISDFATAKWLPEGHTHARTDNKHATTGYLSPERTRRGLICCRSDLWALGVILWELYHGWSSFEYFAYQIPSQDEFADDFDKLDDPRNWNTDIWKKYPEAKSVARGLLTLRCKHRWTASEVLRSDSGHTSPGLRTGPNLQSGSVPDWGPDLCGRVVDWTQVPVWFWTGP
ncbi:kinase-like protein [Fomitiporia mediterranea MF3/22]|uniref:kinase-like protein n=1 Tax=Fomitiporia mediterranea (strain MF3/22) TaxID=694068 RepID=UPI0004409303|nr:kinase-like protein [Fomitiporia mediterranea MF3/22]EJD04890.1 kinase-like protein [Fomitiporia mediterranea MF3/22]